MAVRTNSDLVRGILMSDYDKRATPSLVPFITSASALTDDLSAKAASRGISISAERLRLIETWISAHYYTVSDRRRTMQRLFDGTEGRYETTSYLDTAIQLDPSGLLPGLIKRAVATMLWLGKPPSQQVPYDQRD